MSDEQPIPQPPNYSPEWSRATKSIVTVAFLILIIWTVNRFQSLIGQLVAAAILAYVLNPLIVIIDTRTPLRRSTSILIVYLLLAISFVAAAIALGVAAIDQANTLVTTAPAIIRNTVNVIQSFINDLNPIEIGDLVIFDPSTFNWGVVTNQLLSFVNPLVSQSTQILQGVASTTVRGVTILLFVFVISIYLAIEIPQMGGYVSRLANQPGYRYDAERLTREFGRIWSAYLRGQVILGLVIFLVVWLGLLALGVQNSLALGLLSGLLEFIPIIGPVLGTAVAVTVAIFQPENYMGLSNIQFGLVVLVFMFLVQQLENSVLVPRIVGESLDLHPLIVMVAVFMGGSVAGVLGAILAAPISATIKLLGVYAWRKMFDLPPFPKPEEDPPPPPTLRDRVRTLQARLQNGGKRPSLPENTDSTPSA